MGKEQLRKECHDAKRGTGRAAKAIKNKAQDRMLYFKIMDEEGEVREYITEPKSMDAALRSTR